MAVTVELYSHGRFVMGKGGYLRSPTGRYVLYQYDRRFFRVWLMAMLQPAPAPQPETEPGGVLALTLVEPSTRGIMTALKQHFGHGVVAVRTLVAYPELSAFEPTRPSWSFGRRWPVSWRRRRRVE